MLIIFKKEQRNWKKEKNHTTFKFPVTLKDYITYIL